VLVESGAGETILKKMYIREIELLGLLSVFYSIATKAYEKTDSARYENIPMNTKNLLIFSLKMSR